MFERFTDRARRVVVLAQEEARLLRHDYIGTEHILLGLLREQDGVAALALRELSIDLEAVREQVRERVGTGRNEPQGHIPFTPRAKKVLEFSLREALHLSHNYIGTEHILLGLMREGGGVAAQVLEAQGAEPTAVRSQVMRLLLQERGPDDVPASRFDPITETISRRVSGFTGQLDKIQEMLESLHRRLDAMGAPPDPGVQEPPAEQAS